MGVIPPESDTHPHRLSAVFGNLRGDAQPLKPVGLSISALGPPGQASVAHEHTPPGQAPWPGAFPQFAEEGDLFGWSVSIADYDGNGIADFTAGVREEGIGNAPQAGAANVLYGSVAGLVSESNRFWNQDSPGILHSAEFGDVLGVAVA